MFAATLPAPVLSTFAPISDLLLEQVISKAKQTFVMGDINSLEKMRKLIKQDIKQEILRLKANIEDFNNLYFSLLFDELYSNRVYADAFYDKRKPAVPHTLDIKYRYSLNRFSEELKRDVSPELLEEDKQQTELWSVDAELDDFNFNEEWQATLFYEEYQTTMKAEIKAELKSNPVDESMPRSAYCKGKYYLYRDDCFPHYNANWLAGTKYIAAEGPKQETLGDFLHGLFFSEKMRANPTKVTKIIGLGSCLRSLTTDFTNYSFVPPNVTGEPKDRTATYSVTAKNAAATIIVDVENIYASPDYSVLREGEGFPAGLVVSKFQVTDKEAEEKGQPNARCEVEAILLGVLDGGTIDLSYESQDNTILKDLLWRLSEESKVSAFAIHCAAGIGRTGHLVLLLEILKNYKTIFSGNDADVIDARIEAMIDRLRENREPLISLPRQKQEAIRNAHLVYRYAFENKKVFDEVRVSENNFLSSSPRQSIPEQHVSDVSQMNMQGGPQ